MNLDFNSFLFSFIPVFVALDKTTGTLIEGTQAWIWVSEIK
jgi:hypothetical protein